MSALRDEATAAAWKVYHDPEQPLDTLMDDASDAVLLILVQALRQQFRHKLITVDEFAAFIER